MPFTIGYKSHPHAAEIFSRAVRISRMPRTCSATFLMVLAACTSARPATVKERALEAPRKQLADFISEQWEYTLRTNPEFASILGDLRYNDKLSDVTEKAV